MCDCRETVWQTHCGADWVMETLLSNNQMHRTATTRCGFEGLGLFGRCIRWQSPVPVAVGDLGRWTEKAVITEAP